MSGPRDFLNALFSSCACPIPVRIDGVETVTDKPDVADAVEGDYKVAANTCDGVAFLIGAMEGVQRSDVESCRLPPTVALYKDGTLLLAWSLDRLATYEDAAKLAAEAGMEPVDAYIPMPPSGRWEILHADPQCFYTLEQLREAYTGGDDDGGAQNHTDEANAEDISESEVLGEAEGDDRGREGFWYDARILAPYNEAEYSNPMTVTHGAGRKSLDWVPRTIKVATLIKSLSQHKEHKDKDGHALVFADMARGQRLKTAVKSLWGIGLDIDTGTPSDVMDAALLKLGCLALRYTTHSAFKTETTFRKDLFTAFAGDCEVDTALVRRYLTEVKAWDQSVVDTAEFLDIRHTTEGIMVFVTHCPMPKHRVIVPLGRPFVIAEEAATQAEAMKKWAKVPTALAAILGVPLDRSCTDPSRLFYLPRHAKGRPFETTLFGGPLFDWHTLQLDDPYEMAVQELNKGKAKSVTPEGRGLGRWSMNHSFGFQAADAVNDFAPDKIRGSASRGYDIECPFDENHSNSGDRDDRACFVVNAGEGSSEFFTISCRHEGCGPMTMLDMLGKMLKDRWFERSVLEDERYNAIVDGDAQPSTDSTNLDDRNHSAQELWNRISELKAESRHEEISEVMKQISQLTDPIAEAQAVSKVKKKTGLGKGKLDQKIKEERAKRGQTGTRQGTDAQGRVIYESHGAYDADEACNVIRDAILRANERDPARGILQETPQYTCIFDDIQRLRISGDEVKFSPIGNDKFCAELSDRVMFQGVSDKGAGPRELVPRELASVVYHTVWSQLPQTPEAIRSPIFVPGPKLILEPGWHRDRSLTGAKMDVNVLMIKTSLVVPPVSKNPSDEEVAEALNFLRNELLGDFPFLDVDKSGNETRAPSEANALAMMITPFVRRIIDGCTPMFLVVKPAPGTGGTLLATLPMLLFDGVFTESLNYSPNDEEMQKNLVAAILEGRTHMLFDNVTDLNSRPLIQAITMPMIGGRLLGRSTLVSRPNNFVWIATGNNASISEEMARRICWIRLNAKTANIRGRKFHHKNLQAWTLQKRGKLVGAVLTLVNSWIANGSKLFTARSFPSFDAWAGVLGGILENAGIEGFLDNPRAQGVDLDYADVRRFARSWFRNLGTGQQSVADLAAHAIGHEMDFAQGKDDQDKRRRVRRVLEQMDGQAFEIQGVQLIVRRCVDADGDSTFGLTQIDKSDPNG